MIIEEMVLSTALSKGNRRVLIIIIAISVTWARRTFDSYSKAEADGLEVNENLYRSASEFIGIDCSSNNSFACQSGMCIPSNWACNGYINCNDGSDELLCSEGFYCVNSPTQLLPVDWVCNGQSNCPDNSDEEFCECEATCADGSGCLTLLQVCDGYDHCVDGSDELHCPCADQQFWCHTHQDKAEQCVGLLAVCDGINDCADGSDESVCSPCAFDETRCIQGGSFFADGSPCISNTNVCDLYADCADHSDETAHSCNATCNGIHCLSSTVNDNGLYNIYTCAAPSRHCDGVFDCLDYSDESSDVCCAASEELCLGSYTCYPHQYICDGYSDCPTLLDECGCDGSHSSMFCELSGQCITQDLYCDGKNDCDHPFDWTDECNCEYSGNYSRHCTNTNRCLAPWQVCDGINDCGDMSDEENCVYSLNIASCTGNFYGDFLCAVYTSLENACVAGASVCDGFADCIDGSDENDCQVDCSKGETRCSTGASLLQGFPICIPNELWCDGFAHCYDHSDELYDICQGTTCPDNLNIQGRPSKRWCKANQATANGEYRYYKCLADGDICDNVTDCADGRDEEIPCCNSTQFLCRNTEYLWACYSIDWQCDGFIDCFNGIDENSCAPCDWDKFQCDNGYCISKSKVCDGVQHCVDGSDESEKCDSVSACHEDQWRCRYTRECIHSSEVCDGHQHCADLSDEQSVQCGGLTPYNVEPTHPNEGSSGNSERWQYILIGVGSVMGVGLAVARAVYCWGNRCKNNQANKQPTHNAKSASTDAKLNTFPSQSPPQISSEASNVPQSHGYDTQRQQLTSIETSFNDGRTFNSISAEGELKKRDDNQELTAGVPPPPPQGSTKHLPPSYEVLYP